MKLTGQTLKIRVSGPMEFKSGERYLFETYGNYVRATFYAVLTHILDSSEEKNASGQEAHQHEPDSYKYLQFKVTSSVDYTETRSEGRSYAEDISASIQSDHLQVPIKLLNYSTSGIGFESHTSYQVGAEFPVVISLPSGKITIDAVVARSTKVPLQKEKYHIGCTVDPVGRIDFVRWCLLNGRDANSNPIEAAI